MRHFVCKQCTNPSSFSESGDYCSSPTNLPELDVRNFPHDISGLNRGCCAHRQKRRFHSRGRGTDGKESDLLDHDGADGSGRNLAGLAYLSGAQQAVEGFARVAYPQQLRILLPIAKPLGTIAILIPGWPRLSRGGARNFERNHGAGAIGNPDGLLFRSPGQSPSTDASCGRRYKQIHQLIAS